MYATDLRDQLFAAALPLKPLVVWCGSACSVTVAVPPAPAIEGLAISSVRIELSLPTGEVISAPAVQTAGTPLWTATFAAANFATAGLTTQGFTVYLGGKDETGADRVWIVAKGDLEIRAGDAAPSPGGSYYIVKLRDSAPANPVAGDAYISGGKLHIYSGTAWTTIGGADPSDDDPLMDGVASAGELEEYARGDHRHPSDDSKRGVTDLGVRGAPEGEGSWFAVDGVRADYVGYGEWEGGDNTIATMVGGYQLAITGGPFEFVLDEQYSAVVEGRVIVGYVDTLAKKSEIPTVPTASTATPQMDSGNGSAGAFAQFARGDHVHPSDTSKADAADLPYQLVTPGEWEFSGSGVQSGVTYSVNESIDSLGEYGYHLLANGVEISDYASGSDVPLTVVDFSNNVYADLAVDITATRAFLPGHLLDRANNLIDATTGNVTLTLPPFVAGKVRDLLVACTIGLDGNDEPWSVIFQGGDGEEISFKADGDDAASATFPVPTAAGDWWYSLTERAPHVFAVSLKQLQSVSQPTQTQGGS